MEANLGWIKAWDLEWGEENPEWVTTKIWKEQNPNWIRLGIQNGGKP